jgi:hypothetical protein
MAKPWVIRIGDVDESKSDEIDKRASLQASTKFTFLSRVLCSGSGLSAGKHADEEERPLHGAQLLGNGEFLVHC